MQFVNTGTGGKVHQFLNYTDIVYIGQETYSLYVGSEISIGLLLGLFTFQVKFKYQMKRAVIVWKM